MARPACDGKHSYDSAIAAYVGSKVSYGSDIEQFSFIPAMPRLPLTLPSALNQFLQITTILLSASGMKRRLAKDFATFRVLNSQLNTVLAGSTTTRHRPRFSRLPQNTNPNTQLMEASIEMAVLRGHMASYIHLKNFTLSHCNGAADGLRHGVLWIGQQGWKVENRTISWGDAAGLHVVGENHTLRNCRIENNGIVGMDVLGANEASNWDRYTTRTPQNLLFENLTLSGNNYRRAFDQWHAGGAKIIPGVRGATFRGCTVKNNLGAGIWFDTDWGNNIVEDCLVENNTCGIWWEISETLPADRFGIIIRNNRVLNSRDQGIYVSASSEAIIENNTCHNNNFDIVLHGMPRVAYGYPFMLKNNIVRNNIVAGRTADIVVFEGENARLNIVEGNFYATPKNEDTRRNGAGVAFSATSKGYDVTHRDLKALWQTKGYERTGLSGDPLWQNSQNSDFRIAPDSPAKGKGWQPKTSNN